MDSPDSLINSELLEADHDRISNLPSIATDKILKCLPIQMAANMGVVSTKWRDKWVSLRHLVFDRFFWCLHIKSGDTIERVNRTIANILLHHNGPLHKFHLYIPNNNDPTTTYLSQWLSFLSRSSVKKISLRNPCREDYEHAVPSHIFACKLLVKLTLECFALNRPPSGFKGFAYLRSLELVSVEFKHDMLGSLIKSCPRLAMLKLQYCTGIGMNHLVIDAPSLRSLVIIGYCAIASIRFKSVEQLNRISFWLKPSTENQASGDDDVYNLIKPLSILCRIQYLQLGGHMSKLLAAGSVTNSIPLAFEHLKELCLMEVDLGDLNAFYFTLRLIQNCPCIRDLEISVTVNKNVARHKIELNETCKLDHLIKMKITGITGSSAELQFLEYMLSISVVLEILLFKCSTYHTDSELKLSRDLLRLRRASAKAQLVWLDQ